MLRTTAARQCRPVSLILSLTVSSRVSFKNFSSEASNPTTAPLSLKNRRKKVFRDRFRQEIEEQASPPLAKPFEHAESTVEGYLEKASLSPWVPTPDPLARRMLDLAHAGSDDIHVDLGSGDGRVNFHAIDQPYRVKKSIGIDIDAKLLATARDRLNRIHPRPDMEFLEADLLELDSEAWNAVKHATVITMYFTDEALQRIRPQLEKCLQTRKVRVVTCGYAMPRWTPEWVEVILGLRLYSYQWGFTGDIPVGPDSKMDGEAPLEMQELTSTHAVSEPIAQENLEEAAFPSLDREFREAERVEVPFFDPEEMVDFHWDDFDDENDDWKPPAQ